MKQFDRDKLRVLCEQKGYTGSDLAKFIGTTPSAISHYMKGRNVPSFVHMKRLADVFMCKVDDLLTGEEHKQEVVFQEAEPNSLPSNLIHRSRYRRKRSCC